MQTIYSEQHKLRNAKTELFGGELVPPFERPSRVDHIISQVRRAELGDITEPRDFGLEPALRVHDSDFVTFLQNAWDVQSAEMGNHRGPALVCGFGYLRTGGGVDGRDRHNDLLANDAGALTDRQQCRGGDHGRMEGNGRPTQNDGTRRLRHHCRDGRHGIRFDVEAGRAGSRASCRGSDDMRFRARVSLMNDPPTLWRV